jgi:hypothetical protein
MGRGAPTLKIREWGIRRAVRRIGNGFGHRTIEIVDQGVKQVKAGRERRGDSIADAIAGLGEPQEIGMVFAGFQKYLYRQSA